MFKLWVGCGKLGVDGGITKEDLEEAFEKFGKVEKVWVARQPSGFAFIEFGDERDAQDAIKEMDGAELRGERLKVELSTGGVSIVLIWNRIAQCVNALAARPRTSTRPSFRAADRRSGVSPNGCFPSQRGGGGGARGGGGGGGGPDSSRKPGDWLCPQCHVNNFARRDVCFRCDTAKPRDGGGGGGGGYGGGGGGGGYGGGYDRGGYYGQS